MFRERLYPHFHRRLAVVTAGCAVLFLCLLVRLWQVQMRRGDLYDESIARQSVRRLRVEPTRGRIFASDGAVLVDNRPAFDLLLHPAEMRQPGPRSKTVKFILQLGFDLAERLGRPISLDRARLERHLKQYPALPLTLFVDLTPGEMAKIAEIAPPPPGLELAARIVRAYPSPGLASHVLGFTGRRAPQDAEAGGSSGQISYARPELTGREGIEKLYEPELAGRPGEKLVQVDILGYIHQVLGTPVPPVDGNDLVLTLDLAAQQAAEKALVGTTGAIVCLDVHTGAIVACASAPTFSLATLTPDSYAQLARDVARRPLFNRAVSASYIPGSIIKPLTALAALQTGAIQPDTPVTCHGSYLIGDYPIRCWRREGHGTVDLIHALEGSCNVYFITAGLAAGLDNLLPMLAAAGLGEAPEVDLPAAASGFIPSRAWALAHWKRPWLAVDTAFISIGQGPVSISPLQAAAYVAAIANGGTVFRPFIVQTIRDTQGNVRSRTAPVTRRRLPVTQKQASLVRRGMWEVVNGVGGTARSAQNPYISVAAKTGTAEVGNTAIEEKNAWFIGFAPYETPRYAIAVLVEHGESGGHTASPLARQFLENWLKRRLPAGAAAEAPPPAAPPPLPPAEG